MNFVMQCCVLAFSASACVSSIAVLVFEIVKHFKGKVKISKEEKQRIKEENARKELVAKINALNAKLNKK